MGFRAQVTSRVKWVETRRRPAALVAGRITSAAEKGAAEAYGVFATWLADERPGKKPAKRPFWRRKLVALGAALAAANRFRPRS